MRNPVPPHPGYDFVRSLAAHGYSPRVISRCYHYTEGRRDATFPAGEMVAAVWRNLAHYYPGVSLDAYVVMPNHLHGIVVLTDRDGATVPTDTSVAISLSTLIQRFKTFTAHEYRKGVAEGGWARYPGRLWQHRFQEHVIRNERELDAVRTYIINNPTHWDLDHDNVQGGHAPFSRRS